MAAGLITLIPSKSVHDNIVAESNQIPTVIYVSNSSMPICKAFTPRYEALAQGYSSVRFCQMEFATETAAMFKFSPNQLPVVVLMCTEAGGSNWCRTMMSPRIEELEGAVRKILEREGRGQN